MLGGDPFIARFKEGYKTTADRLGLMRPEDSDASIFQSVRDWVCEEKNGRWIMKLDNADDAAMFQDRTKGAVRNGD